MSAEDHERMKAAIDADRERLAAVQDHIIRLNARRHGIELELKNGILDEEQSRELFNAEMMLAEEQKERMDKEDEILAVEEQEINAYLDATVNV